MRVGVHGLRMRLENMSDSAVQARLNLRLPVESAWLEDLLGQRLEAASGVRVTGTGLTLDLAPHGLVSLGVSAR